MVWGVPEKKKLVNKNVLVVGVSGKKRLNVSTLAVFPAKAVWRRTANSLAVGAK